MACLCAMLRLWFLCLIQSWFTNILHKTVLNLISFTGPCFTVLCLMCICGQKKVISLDRWTNTRYKMTIFCVFVNYMSTHMSFHLEPNLCYIQNSPNIYLRMLNLPPNYCNNLPKCGGTCTRGTSPPNKSVNFAKKRSSPWWRLSLDPMALLCHFLATLLLQPLRNGLFEGSVEGFYWIV